MYICIYIHVCIVSTYMYAMSTYLYIHICIHLFIYTYIHMYISIYKNINMYLSTHNQVIFYSFLCHPALLYLYLIISIFFPFTYFLFWVNHIFLVLNTYLITLSYDRTCKILDASSGIHRYDIHS
jgi:apolipoprotein D and lipocalin family protein